MSVEEQLAVLKRRRAAAKGTVTKVTTQFKGLSSVHPRDINFESIEHQLQVLQNCDKSYHEYHDTLVENFASNVDLEQESSDFYEFGNDVSTLRGKLQDLSTAHNSFKSLDLLSAKVNSLDRRVSDSPESISITEIDKVADQIEELLKISINSRLPEIKELQTALDHQQNKFFKIQAEFTKIQRTACSSTSAPAPTEGSSRSKIKLPELCLPSFDGDPLNWSIFWDRFQSTLSKVSDLTDSDKMVYLRSAIKCKSGQEILDAETGSGDDYDLMVHYLKAKFEQKRLVHKSHLKALLQHKISTHSHEDLDRTQALWRKHMIGLEKSGQLETGALLTSLAEISMNEATHAEWSKFTTKFSKVPDIKVFNEFLDEQLKALPPKSKSSKPQQSKAIPRAAVHHVNVNRKCLVCEKEFHPLYLCPTFKDLSVDGRFVTVQRHKLCNNCLGADHSTRNCRCLRTCKKCGKKHHTLLHREDSTASRPSKEDVSPTTSSQTSATAQTALPNANKDVTTVLMTCQLMVEAKGNKQKARALLDTGSSISFITSRLANALQAKKIPKTTTIVGIQGAQVPNSLHVVDLVLSPLTGTTTTVKVTAAVVDRITTDLPIRRLPNIKDSPVLKGLHLADPEFDLPGRINLLLGMDCYNDIIQPAVVTSENSSLKAYQSIFGYVVAGPCHLPGSQEVAHVSLHSTTADEQSNQLIKSFWEVEELQSVNLQFSSEEKRAIEDFDKTHFREEDGRYSVRLPRRIDSLKLGNSREQALKRYLSTERSLVRKGKWEAFKEVVDEYFKLGHAEKVPLIDLNKPDEATFYLPMHGVVRESSTTTKLRVVFDASARTTSGVSLNDILIPGPSLYPSLISIILKFRWNTIGMTADISKMFREISLHLEDRDFHRFLWREETSKEVVDFRMTRLTFGVTSSPFLATKVLRQLAEDYKHSYVKATQTIQNSFYVDDCLTGADTLEEAIALRNSLNEVLAQGGMTLRKWRSSSSLLLDTIPDILKEKEPTQALPTASEQHKALGIHWNTSIDSLHVATPPLQVIDDATKRTITSDIARTFDVMGWCSPAVVKMKILLQRIWELGLEWDEKVPPNIEAMWRSWRKELPLLTTHPVQRCYFSSTQERIIFQLHGFSDASQKAYGAVVYLRCVYADASTSVALVISKTKVAPIKKATIPRLELCGAHLLAKLLSKVSQALNIKSSNLYAWSDSTIVLSWLNAANPRKLKTFESNRVVEIVTMVPAINWRYVPTADNPADVASRGLMPSELLNCVIWWNGPSWLSESPNSWPSTCKQLLDESDSEVRSCNASVVDIDNPWLVTKYSSYTTLVRVLTRVKRFINNCRVPAIKSYSTKFIHLDEYQEAESFLLLQSQERSFSAELHALRKSNELPKRSSLNILTPYLDHEGLLRVGGRLNKGKLAHSQRHPIILSSKDKLTRLLVRHHHLQSCHAGPSMLLPLICRDYHILSARKLIRSIFRQCVICRKQQARTSQQLMGQLPKQRLTPGAVFQSVGTDFAGPLYLKLGPSRRPTLVKVYVCIFVCLSVKAVHLELVSNLSSEAFLACLRRFVARRGKPMEILSDNGSNYIGANHDLKNLYSIIQEKSTQQSIHQYCTSNGIKWTFSPERAPHFGGLWESTVKSMKSLLRRVLGENKLTFEEMSTVLCQVESCLNSRPLVPLNSPSEDGVEALTPGHFLVGKPLEALPDQTDVQSKLSLSKRWNLCQVLAREFWSRWSKEYLLSLNRQTKWFKNSRNFMVGDIVLVKDQQLFTHTWPLGRIVKTFTGSDGKVRVVDVQTKSGIYRRPIVKLVLLLSELDED